MKTHLAKVWTWGVPVAVVVACGLIAALAPEERTLGSAIRAVYLHVPLMWTGLNGMLLVGLCGLAVAIGGWKRLYGWTESIAWVGLGLFASGLGMSMVAAQLSWGSPVVWTEPRTRTAIAILIFGLALSAVVRKIPQFRLGAVLWAVFGVVVIWALLITPLELHPRDAASNSDSAGIRNAFLSLFAVMTLGQIWMVHRVHKLRRPALAEQVD